MDRALFLKERDEAIAAGERALVSLKRAQSELSGARTWGAIDMLGGSFFSSLIKRSKIKNAQACLQQASNDLAAFSRELGDVNRFSYINVDVGDLLGLADLFYENFLVDLLMQNRINTARGKVSDAISKVQGAVDQLKRM